MPNWCENRVKISGPKTSIKYFAKKLDKKEVFMSFLPRPKEKDEGEEWYTWNINNWGIKWDVEAQGYIEDDEYIEFDFDSPWGPPIDGIIGISKLYPKLIFTIDYEEPGMEIKGTETYKNGKNNYYQ